jgi:hypothetical protein
LAKLGNWKKTGAILERIGGKQYAIQEQMEIAETLKGTASKIDWEVLRSKKVRPILFSGVILAVFQQWCCINVIFNYADLSASGASNIEAETSEYKLNAGENLLTMNYPTGSELKLWNEFHPFLYKLTAVLIDPV